MARPLSHEVATRGRRRGRGRGLVSLLAAAAILVTSAVVGSPASAAAPAGPPPAAVPAPQAMQVDEHELRVVRSVPAWAFLEVQAREMVAELHGVPDDAHLLTSARQEISAAVFGLLLTIVETPEAERTPAEQSAYNELRHRLHTSERSAADHALFQYGSWGTDPCRYQPPNGFTYNRHLACSPMQYLYSGARPPSAGEFMTYGQLWAYPWMRDELTATAASGVMSDFVFLASLLSGGVAGVLSGLGLLASGSASAVYALVAPFAGKAMTVLLSAGGSMQVAAPYSTAALGATAIGFAVGVVVFALVTAASELALVLEAREVPGALEEHAANAQQAPVLEQVLAEDGGVGRLFAPFYGSLLDGNRLPDIPTPEVAWEPGAAGHRYETTRVEGGGAPTVSSTFASLDHQRTPQVSYEDRDGWLITRRGGGPAVRSLSVGVVDDHKSNGAPARARVAVVPGGFVSAPDGTDTGLWAAPCVDDHPRCLAGDTFLALDHALQPAHVRRIPNEAPSAPAISLSQTDIVEGTPVTLSAGAVDPEGEPLTYEWRIERPPCRKCWLPGDPGVDVRSGSTVSHTFTDSGTFRVEAIASDPGGMSTSSTVHVEVANGDPTVQVAGRGTVAEGVASGIDVTWTDPGQNDSHQVVVDWGDGTVTSADHPSLDIVGGGRDLADGSRRLGAQHTYADGGTYTVAVTVTDDDGGSGTASTTLEVTAPEPAPPGSVAPGAPRAVLAWAPAGVDDLTMAAFIAPDDGGAPILRYEVTTHDGMYCGDAPPCVFEPALPAEMLSPSALRAFAGEFPAPTPDQMKVRAVTAVGPGPWSAVATPTTEDGLSGFHPRVAVDGPTEVDEGSTVTLSLEEPTLAPGRAVDAVAWDVGADGTVDSESDTVTFSVGGDRTEVPVEVTVIDDADWPTTVRHTVTVRNLAPTLTGLEGEATTDENRFVTLAGTVGDPGGDDVVVTVDWGDGSWSGTSGPVEAFALTHTFPSGGRFPVVVTATDADGATTVHRMTVTAPGIPSPTASVRYVFPGNVSWDASRSGNADHYVVTVRDVVEGEVGPVVHTAETTGTSIFWETWSPMRTYEVEVAACSAQGCASPAERPRTMAPTKWVWARGRVLLPDGSPAPNQWVRAFAESDEDGAYSGIGGTDAEGYYEMQLLAPQFSRFEITPQPHTPDLRVSWLGGEDREGATLFDVSEGVDVALPDLVMSPLVDPDTDPPVVEVTEAPSGETTATSASVVFTVDDDTATVECRLDEGEWAPCESPFEVADLALGERTVEVRATDEAGNVGSQTVSWTVVAARSATEAWVVAVHVDLLGREPTSAELADAVARLEGGTSPAVVARGLVTSDEWLGHVVDGAYQVALGREADAAGRAFWVGELRQGRRQVTSLMATFYASAEHYRGRGGGTDRSWVEELYRGVLGREGSATDVAFWAERVPTLGRAWVAQHVVASPESAARRVDVLYAVLLGRPSDPGGRAHWAGRVPGEGELALAVHLVVSPEYQERAAWRFP